MATTVFDYLAWLEGISDPSVGDDSDDRTYTWDAEIDREIAKLRVKDRKANAGFLAAAAGGAGILPISFTRVDGTSRINPLVALSRRGGDEDWVIVTRNRPGSDSFRFEDMAWKLSPCAYETHLTPTWTIFICFHA